MCTRRILVSAFRLFFCFLCLRAAFVRLTLRGAVGRGVLLFFGKNRVHYYTHHPHFPTAPLALFVLRLIISKRSEYQTTILSSSFFLLTVNCQFFPPKKISQTKQIRPMVALSSHFFNSHFDAFSLITNRFRHD
jgi:hypothetical protein